jgi:hypothetical protein
MYRTIRGDRILDAPSRPRTRVGVPFPEPGLLQAGGEILQVAPPPSAVVGGW